MSDEKLIFDAATSAEIDVFWGHPSSNYQREGVLYLVQPERIMYTALEWNPLTDDGDALRLAAKLQMYINILSYCVCASAGGDVVEEKIINGDTLAAVRRAIVRAAAELRETNHE